MAHELFMAGQALTRIRDSVRFILDAWIKVYRGNLGIALTDIISSKIFFEDFDLYYSKLFDGVRHDSGNAIDYGNMVIDHYNKMKINPMTKTIIFSDGLTVDSAIELWKIFNGRINVGFGIGTSITNNVGETPLNIVLKMTKCNNQDVAKISDSSGKCIISS